MPKNKVFIATSIDGYIADRNGQIEWLHSIPNPDDNDMGYCEFMSGIDALIIGRNTFETVAGFDIPWPYKKPVFLLSNSLLEVPKTFKGKVELVNGDLNKVLANVHNKGYTNLYIDGGKTIQSFLKEDLIDDMIITVIPILLGTGVGLFSDLLKPLKFKCVKSQIYLNQIVQNHFERER